MTDFLDDIGPGYQDVVGRMRDALTRTGVVTDFTVGSVARTLVETFAREMATFYAMLERAHEAGYLDTAEGQALDNVVAVLGLRRAMPGRLIGRVEFTRLSPAPNDVYIPASVRVTGPLQGKVAVPILETVEEVTLKRGERAVQASVQEIPGSELKQWNAIPQGTLTIVTRPILGVEGVNNPDPIVRSSEVESDEHLRARAREALREAQRGTAEAIEAAIRQLGIKQVEVIEPGEGPPGRVLVRISDPGLAADESMQVAVSQAIRSAKAAGVLVDIQYLRTVYVQPVVFVEPEDVTLDDLAFQSLADALRTAVGSFIDGLAAGTPISRQKLSAVFLNNPAVRDITIDSSEFRTFVEGAGGVSEDAAARAMPSGDWFLGPMESAAVDATRWPPTIERRLALEARMDVTVVVNADSPLSDDTIEQTIRAAIETYVAGQRQAGAETPSTVRGEDLAHAITTKAPVKEVTEITLIHLQSGAVDILNEPDQGYQVGSLAPGERLTVGTIRS